MGIGETGFTNTERVQFANVFEARGSETVQAVSIFLATAGSQVDIAVYRNPTGLTDDGTLNPQSGTLKWSTTLSGANAGYTTIDLGSDAFPVIAGDTFSVVASAQEPNGNYLMLAEVDDAAPRVRRHRLRGWPNLLHRGDVRLARHGPREPVRRRSRLRGGKRPAEGVHH